MAIDYSLFAIPKGMPSVLTKGWKKREDSRKWDALCSRIDQRDGMISRVSGKQMFTNTNDPKLLRDHCHLKSKGAHPEWKYEDWNVFNATRYEHKLIHSGAIEVEGTDANKKLIFHWNRRIVKAGQEPFKLISKRRTGR